MKTILRKPKINVFRRTQSATIEKRKKLLEVYPRHYQFKSQELVSLGLCKRTCHATEFLLNMKQDLVLEQQPIRLRREGDKWYFDRD